MLTERIARDAKSKGKARTIWDGEVKGLGLQITQGGKKNYVIRLHGLRSEAPGDPRPCRRDITTGHPKAGRRGNGANSFRRDRPSDAPGRSEAGADRGGRGTTVLRGILPAPDC